MALRASGNTAQAAGAATTALFRLLCEARQSFPAASPEVLASLRAGLDALHAEDLQVRPQDAAKIRCQSGIGYQDVYSGPEMTLCIFLLRQGAKIPLHDHPGMHVFGRLLFGRMRSLSYDPEPVRAGARRAVLRSDHIVGPAPTTYSLGPDEGNVHELEALEHAAFFDVLTPPYNPYAGRDCTYFKREGEDAAGGCTLVPVDLWGFSMDTLPYRGPAFPT